MQKEINKNMNSRQAFIYTAEKIGIKIQYYLDTRDENFLEETIMYVRSANILMEEMKNEGLCSV